MSRRYSGAFAALLVAIVGCETKEDASRLRNRTTPDDPSIRVDLRDGGAHSAMSDSGHPQGPGVRERMVKDDRSWMKSNPNDRLVSVVDLSGEGVHLHLTGSIAAFEGQSMIALVNVSRDGQPLVLQKWFEAGGGSGIGKLDVVVDIPTSVAVGDCLAVKDVSGGRGFTDDEVRLKEEFGAFLYTFTDDDGTHHPTGTTGPKVFRAAEDCLADPAANRSEAYQPR